MNEQPSFVSHIRNRPAMYIGDINISGLKRMIGYILEEIQLDVFQQTEIIFELKENDYIHLHIKHATVNTFVEVTPDKRIHMGHFYLGLSSVVALSEHIHLQIQNSDSILSMTGNKGGLTCETNLIHEETNEIIIDFKIDADIFNAFTIDYEIINQYIRKYAFLNPKFLITSCNTRTSTNQTIVFDYPQGLSHELTFQLAQQHAASSMRMDLQTTIGAYDYQICFAYQENWLGKTYILTYANYDELIYRGSLEKGILEGLIAGFKAYALQKNVEIIINTKKVQEQLVLVASMKGENINWYGATKTSIEMPAVRKVIKKYIAEQLLSYLQTNEIVAEKLLHQFIKRH